MPRTETVSIFKFVLPKMPVLEPVVGSQYGTKAEAAESLIAHINSHSKHTMLRCENRKIGHENKILKEN
jgi:hypothetical protein